LYQVIVLNPVWTFSDMLLTVDIFLCSLVSVYDQPVILCLLRLEAYDML